ncbi:thiol reductant ABC exporter subunit CydD [Massilia sp. DWR3-1-1]|uniref:thiol reductant ABC exporter subunit CydD n=1 Tax=Massilia sp. DWR3-1-1 TaxID=2804559 RepID=UPI003CEBD22F
MSTPLPAWRREHAAATRAGAVAGGAAALLWIVQAGLIAVAVDHLAGAHQATAALAPVAWCALGYLGTGVLRASVEAWGARAQFAASRACLSRLRADAAQALAGCSPLERARLPSGQAASVLAEQAEAVLPWLLRYQPARWRALVVPPLIALCVASLSWLAALILLLSAPLIPVFMAVIGWRAQAASQAQLRQQGGMNGFLLDRLRGLSSLRALGAVELTAGRLGEAAQALRRSTMQVLRIAFLSSTALELFASLGVALVAVYIGFHLLGELGPGSWGRRLTLGQGLFILLLAPAFYEPLRELALLWHDKAAGDAASAALAALGRDTLALTGAGPLAAGAQAAPAGPLAVELAALRFAHPGAAPLWQGLALHIGAGERVALVGASGAGKTTLLSIIAGLAPASDGAVRIGGLLMSDATAGALRARMAWVGQLPHIFNGTVGANVSLRRPGVSAQAVRAAIEAVGLGPVHHASANDILGEAGAGLSGGELVRLSLARAAVAPGAGLLLVDEPTAHLDRHSAAAIADALLAIAGPRTLIVATHDLALAARMDRVIDLDALARLAELAVPDQLDHPRSVA